MKIIIFILPPLTGLEDINARPPWATLAPAALRLPTSVTFRGYAAGRLLLTSTRLSRTLAQPHCGGLPAIACWNKHRQLSTVGAKPTCHTPTGLQAPRGPRLCLRCCACPHLSPFAAAPLYGCHLRLLGYCGPQRCLIPLNAESYPSVDGRQFLPSCSVVLCEEVSLHFPPFLHACGERVDGCAAISFVEHVQCLVEF